MREAPNPQRCRHPARLLRVLTGEWRVCFKWMCASLAWIWSGGLAAVKLIPVVGAPTGPEEPAFRRFGKKRRRRAGAFLFVLLLNNTAQWQAANKSICAATRGWYNAEECLNYRWGIETSSLLMFCWLPIVDGRQTNGGQTQRVKKNNSSVWPAKEVEAIN